MRRILDRDSQKEKTIEQSKFHLSGAVMVTQDGLMDVLRFYVFSTVFQSYQDERNVVMKGSVQWNPLYSQKDIRLKISVSSEPRTQDR